MKNKVKKEDYRNIREVFVTKLNSGNVFKAINTWAVSVVRYSGAFLGWSRFQLWEIEWRTRKLLAMHNGFHPKSNVEQRIDWSSRYCGDSNFGVNKLCKKQRREIVNC